MTRFPDDHADEEQSDRPGQSDRPDRRRLSRRQFVAMAGTAALAALAGSEIGTARRAGASARTSSAMQNIRRFRSRPDLDASRISVRLAGRGSLPGYAFLTVRRPMIVDQRGEPVWIHPVPNAATNLRVQRYRGQQVLTWWEGTITKWGTGSGHGVILDDHYRNVATVQCGNGLTADLHELLLTDRGTAYLTAVDEVDGDLRPVGGPRHGRLSRSHIQEVDVATGKVLFQWNSADHIPLEETQARWSSKSAGKPFSAVHLNSINLTNDGNILVSARNTWTLYKIDPSTGKILWRLGGRSSDFTLGNDVQFAWQHCAAQHRDGTISLFDDEAGPEERSQSRALFLNVDEQAMHATIERAYVHSHPHLLATSQGSVQVLPDGDVFVGWGSEPWYTRFAHDGSVRLDAKIEKLQSYRAFHFGWSGKPTERPAIAIERRGHRPPVVYASWNGATEHRWWRVLEGDAPSRLVPLRVVARSGFETSIPLREKATYVAVEALDGGGSVLSASAPVAA